MSGHDLSAGGDVLGRVEGCARAALGAYGLGADAALTLLNVSENATFLIEDPGQGRSVLRVHRLGYHSERAIASELAWTDALREQAGIRTPRALPARDGRRIVTVPESAVPESAAPEDTTSSARRSLRHCVRFEFLPGTAPASDADRGPADFADLGELTARMHAHARTWDRPGWFTRFAWDAGAAFGPAARWGHWRDGPGVGAAERAILRRLEETLTARLAAYGTGRERFGLVHADTRLANLLVCDGNTAVIDFDDCGFSWYLYDLGTTVSFFEDDPGVPALLDAWLSGYRKGGGLVTAADEADVWTFVLLRRLLLLGWMGTHPAAAGVAGLSAAYAGGSCDLAERYLSGSGGARPDLR
jgi:Ser/Thr protein kinase RdoA (MazF antagonist)